MKNEQFEPRRGKSWTPVCDWVERYAAENPVRMHMPGHKGRVIIGPERLDITEIDGADELFRSRGILRESEENAAALFGAARTVYSAEGSSLAIRAMLYLAALTAERKNGKLPPLLAGRNAHRALMTAAALLDLEVEWLLPGAEEDLLSCTVTPEMLEEKLTGGRYLAVYLTSPDYLGRMADIAGAAEVCRRHGVPLLADNAHGAYLRFLSPDLHPLTLGADACCDSAHKTLPCLTGAAWLHLSERAPEAWRELAEEAMSLFGSTSPSWLILQSLDRVNSLLAGDYPQKLRETAKRLEQTKKALAEAGWEYVGDEPMKLTLRTAPRGWTGTDLARRLRDEGIVCEFADLDHVVLMPSGETEEEDWARLEAALRAVPRRETRTDRMPGLPRPERVCSIRAAMLSPGPVLPVMDAVGRVLADAAVSCPPAVPIVAAGERITREAAACMAAWGITECRVTADL